MTEREKHIGALKDLKEWLITFSNGSHVKEIEAIDYAISSLKVDLAYDLEYERTAKNDLGIDCIVDVLGSYTDLDIPYKHEIAENILTKLPSVTLIRPKGHWIMTSDYLTTAYGSIDYVKCSCCSEDSLEEGDYCPNCGADMREV